MEVARYVEENDDEQITINDLIDLMQEKLANCEHEAYGYKHIKTRLLKHFGKKIICTEIKGKPNVVTIRTTARLVLQDYYKTTATTNKPARREDQACAGSCKAH